MCSCIYFQNRFDTREILIFSVLGLSIDLYYVPRYLPDDVEVA